MLTLDNSRLRVSSTTQSQVNYMPQLDLLSLIRIVKRRWTSIVVTVGAALLLAVAYLMLAPNRYDGTALVLVDDNKNSIISKDEGGTAGRQPDPALIESQVEVAKSETVMLTTVRKLALTSDQEFMYQNTGFISRAIKGVVDFFRSRPSGAGDEAERERAAVDLLSGDVKAKRVGASYVIQIDYRNRNPFLAAKIANGLAGAFIAEESNARNGESKGAARWLEDQIVELRSRVAEADLAVQRYKAEHNIIDTSRGLISDQQLSDLNSQLVNTRATTAEAKARYERIAEIAKAGNVVEANVGEALRSEVITRLRAQYLDLANHKAELARRYGLRHMAVVKLAEEMSAIAESIDLEMRRIAEAAKNDYMIASAREISLRESLNALIAQSANASQWQVELRNLESAAQANRNMYDLLLQKLSQSTQEQTLPIHSARVITPAAVPQGPSWPKPGLVLGSATVVGAILGFVFVLLRETFNNCFRSPEDVRNYTGLEYLGTLPKIIARAPIASPKARGGETVLGAGNIVARQSVVAPFSRFTETLRNVKVSIDLCRQVQETEVIAITSALPKEGKSTVAANLGLLCARMGLRTLLIDADLHNPSLTRTLCPAAGDGLIAVLRDHVAYERLLRRDSISGMEFLPAGVRNPEPNCTTLLTSQAMANLLDEARRHYDIILLDMPPLLPVVDVKAAAHLVDHFVFVIAWDMTTRDAVRDALIDADHVRDRTIGVVLNNADETMLKRMESYRGPNYGNYYVNPSESAEESP